MRYDRFQQEAIGHIENGHSVMVSAPTGSGKTAIAEHVITDCLAKGKNAIYTAPIKALSNQKFRDFKEIYGDKIGILTGDVTINPTAPILIMTTEIFRNKVLEEESGLENYSWIIFDEIHYLDDYERGTVWEESLIFLPGHMKMLALSATIPNIDEFAGWIQAVHKKPVKIVTEDTRPVPLHFFYQCQGKIADSLNEIKKIGYRPEILRARKHHSSFHLKPNKVTSLIGHLFQNDRLPCIYFSFSRKRCEYLAREMTGFNFLSADDARKIKGLYDELAEKFALTGEKSAALLAPLIEKGIAYHHAGMLPTLKEAVERLFTSRLIKVIFTTETFSLGINMPARTVAFDELRKYYGRYFGTLKSRDFYQMAGRSGRRGIDKEGFVYSRVNPHRTSFHDLYRIIYGRPEKVHSRFNTSYATTLNLYQKYGEKLYDIYPSSFHYYQEKERFRDKALKHLHSKVKILKEFGHIKDDALTEKGYFASKIYGYELPLAQMHEGGFLEYLSEVELAILCLAMVFEPRKGAVKPRLNKRIKSIRNETERILRHIQAREKNLRIVPLSKNYFYHLTHVLEAWMQKEPFDKILSYYPGADEGGIIRYFRMTVQILREILDTPASSELKGRAKKAIELINRDIIDAEKQLRE